MLFDVTRCGGGAAAVVCLVFLSLVQTGCSLRCDFCYDIEDCSLGPDVPTVVCDEESVQLTNGSLASFIRPLRSSLPTLPNQYECVHVRATSVSGHVFLFVRGCVHRLDATPTRHFCSLPHAAFQGSLECVACSEGDRCNNIPLNDDDDDDDDGGSLSGASVQRSPVALMSFFSVLALCLRTLHGSDTSRRTVIMPFS
uniref:Putative salivary secreted peptide n=1 Tax=Anopheles marajoara TaxID=58244 RepID=A0A2M4C074_9DIPT